MSFVSDSVRPHRQQPTRLPRPWDSPGKNTGVGCHFLLQCVKVKSLSCVRLLATPWTEAYQTPPSMGFSRQEYWSGVPLPSPLKLSYYDASSFLLFNLSVKDYFFERLLLLQSCPTLRDPMDCSLPDSSVHGIFQARVLELGAIAFSGCTLHISKISRVTIYSLNVLLSLFRTSLLFHVQF